MTQEQALVVTVLVATVAMFIWGRWRHDMVALGALLACVLLGLVPAPEAFAGFGHPAVVTVACVLILSQGLQATGAVDALTRRILPSSAGPALTITALTALAAGLSAFMNNVGALALLMPVAIQAAARQEMPPGRVLMPVAFGSILGGMTTLIGTPPNMIVSGFRAQSGAGGFGMFDFTPAGLAVAGAGIAFVILGGWRLVPSRKGAGAEGFETGAYLTEARVPEKSKTAGMTLREIEEVLNEAEAQVIGLIRGEVQLPAPNPWCEVRAGDILIIEADPEALASALSSLGLDLEEAKGGDENEKEARSGNVRKAIQSDEVILMELAILPDSYLLGRTATDIRLRTRYCINLLAISRRGERSQTRLGRTRIAAGDVLLTQGTEEALGEFAADYGCVPLAERSLRLPSSRQALLAAGIMAAVVGAAAFSLAPAVIAFSAGVLAAVALRVVPLRALYNAVDWPVIVLLGALIPVAEAMAATGAADLIGRLLLDGLAGGHAIAPLVVILVVTMTLSDFMNNAATAAVMCPIAIGVAGKLGASADPYLMAVAVGASCAFLTPIGHQNNTLILGPGGFRFGDYWRLGLPLEMIVVAVGVPVILLVWPL